jgi:hypothetical protein
MRALLLTTTGALILTASTLSASHPERDQMERFRVAAHELEDAARHVHREAERRSHHYDRSEAYALARLHDLESSASHFHKQVERYRRDPYHTQDDFLALRAAYDRAVRSLGALHGDHHLQRDFEQVARWMRALDAYYGGPYGYGRYDRGGYDRQDQGYHGRGQDTRTRLWFDLLFRR